MEGQCGLTLKPTLTSIFECFQLLLISVHFAESDLSQSTGGGGRNEGSVRPTPETDLQVNFGLFLLILAFAYLHLLVRFSLVTKQCRNISETVGWIFMQIVGSVRTQVRLIVSTFHKKNHSRTSSIVLHFFKNR